MNQKIRHFIAAITACTVTAAALAAFPVQAVGDENVPAAAVTTDDDDSFIEHLEGTGGGDEYAVFKPDDAGSISFDINKLNKNFSCSWSGIKLVDFCAGKTDHILMTDKKLYLMDYRAEIKCKDSFCFGATFNCYERGANELTEIRVLEAYSDVNGISEDNKVFDINVNGAVYNVYRSREVYDEITVNVIIAARAENLRSDRPVSGRIDIRGVIDGLQKNGVDFSSLMSPRYLLRAEEGEGSAELFSNNIITVDYPKEMDVPNDYNSTIIEKKVYRDGLTYAFWQDDSCSNGSMKVERNGDAKCTVDNDKDDASCLFTKGFFGQAGIPLKDITKLKADYHTVFGSKSSYIGGIYGWMTDPYIEFYIIEVSNGKEDFLNNAELVDTAEIDNITFDIYKRKLPVVGGLTQYFSVSRVEFEHDYGYGVYSTVDLLKHIEAWEKAGLKPGKNVRDVSAFVETKGKGKGDFSITDVNISMDRSGDSCTVLGADTPSVTIDGYKYYRSGDDGVLTVEKDGIYHAKCFNDRSEDLFSFGKGREFDSDEVSSDKNSIVVLDYNADVSTDGTYRINAEGTLKGENDDPYIRYLICDASNAPFVPLAAEKLGIADIDGEDYDIYVRHTRFSYRYGGRCIDEYYSVKRGMKGNHINVSGSIDLAKHIKAWRAAGLVAGDAVDAYINTDICGAGDGNVYFNRAEVKVKADESAEGFDENDVELLKKFLLGEKCDVEGKDFDINGDGVWDSFDLIALRRIVK